MSNPSPEPHPEPQAEPRLPVYVDTRRVFHQQRLIRGCVDLARLPRFRQELASERASVQVEFGFRRSGAGQRLIQGRLTATVEVICQRCLEPLAVDLEDDIRLALVADETAATALDPALDAWICADARLDLASVVEEQLLLCMPIVNYHPDPACRHRLQARTAPAPLEACNSPFAVLETLIK